MFKGNLEMVRERVEHLKFAILKIRGKNFLPMSRCMVETLSLDNEGNLRCITDAEFPKVLSGPRGFDVTLKYAGKEEKVYLMLCGHAYIEKYVEVVNEQLLKNLIHFHHIKKVSLLIRISSAEVFKKRTLSKYTSFLQSVGSLSFKKILTASKFAKKTIDS